MALRPFHVAIRGAGQAHVFHEMQEDRLCATASALQKWGRLSPEATVDVVDFKSDVAVLDEKQWAAVIEWLPWGNWRNG